MVYAGSPSLDDALKVAYLHSSLVPAAAGKEVLIDSPYAGECCAWILLMPGAATIREVRHSCWHAKGTLYGHQARTFQFDGGTLRYRLMYPRNYDSKKAYPLAISVSGSDTLGDDNAKQMNLMTLGRSLFTQYYFDPNLECFSLVPQIPGPDSAVPPAYWPRGAKGQPTRLYHPDSPAVNEDGWFVQATLALIAGFDKDQAVNIDPDRVYCTGYSYGGKAVFEFLKAGPRVFAGAIPCAGWAIGPPFFDPAADRTGMLLDQLKLEVKRYKHIPMQICDGQNDRMHSAGAAVNKEILAQGGKSQYVEFPGGDHASAAASTWGDPARIKWLFEQKRGDNANQ
jgi:predicted peptidase